MIKLKLPFRSYLPNIMFNLSWRKRTNRNIKLCKLIFILNSLKPKEITKLEISIIKANYRDPINLNIYLNIRNYQSYRKRINNYKQKFKIHKQIQNKLRKNNKKNQSHNQSLNTKVHQIQTFHRQITFNHLKNISKP